MTDEQPTSNIIKKDSNVVLIGGKPTMSYVTAVIMQFNMANATEVIIKSRGKYITHAVDIAEIVRNRFMRDMVHVKSVGIGSEAFTGREGRNMMVSTIEITLSR